MPPDDSASNEYINNLQNEIDHLKLSLASANASTGIDVENIVKENTDLRIQLEESRKKLEMVQVATNATPSTTTITTNDDDPSWPHDRDEFIKQWTIQANEWNSMRELLEKDKNSFYEIGRAWEIESLKFQALADEREQELKKCKKEIIELSEKVLLVSQPSSSSVISHEEYQKKVKQLEMDMAQKWMSLLMRRKKSFLLRRSFDIMRQQQSAKKSKVTTLNTGIQSPPIGSSAPPIMSSPSVSTTNYYPTNEASPAQELRHRRPTTTVTAEEEKQLQSDFNIIKQLQRSNDKTVVIDRQDKVYNLMSSIFYKSIIWLLLIVVAFLYIKSCSVGTSSRPVRLTA